MSSSLKQLKATGSVIVCDSGDFANKYKPQDATTNPSLILAASKKAEYACLINSAISYGKKQSKDIDGQVDSALDRLLVEFGKEILQIIPGKVSTEVDARFSFDTEGSINKALHIIKLYEEIGIPKERILIKVASTWEGIQAAHILQSKHGINCNLTLMFSLVQAIAAAEAGAFLISPFVGRILDWYKAAHKRDYSAEEDPEDLYNSTDSVPKKLDSSGASGLDIPMRSYLDREAQFRFDFNEEAMAVEKLREGISKFAADAVTLKGLLMQKLQKLQT
ncbi:Aldolase-type TIM barrel [Penicillium italicum]|uniref:Transaldolase n=1 Tax=Penicillium italicum TaxID=40296 RepID=A0A0A2KQV0_PENIT|nr:Aldolase-type TIM barrel [Penicillium italicum]